MDIEAIEEVPDTPTVATAIHEFIGGFSLAFLAALLDIPFIWEAVAVYAVSVFGISVFSFSDADAPSPSESSRPSSSSSSPPTFGTIEWAGAFLLGVVLGSIAAGVLGLAVPGWSV